MAKTRQVIVPSLRADVVGARGFGVSRNLFARAAKEGKVRLNGLVAEPKSAIQTGDVLSVAGVGRLVVQAILGETKKGNYRLELELIKLPPGQNS
ncbi:MAG: hypothetical protein HY335_07475 [Deinococcus sp.]|nr:hypothetical protein [Deinococcus sp.]